MVEKEYIYFITEKGKRKFAKMKAAPGAPELVSRWRWHFSRSARALWLLNRQGAGGGTAKYISDYIEPTRVKDTIKTLNRLVTQGFVKRRQLT